MLISIFAFFTKMTLKETKHLGSGFPRTLIKNTYGFIYVSIFQISFILSTVIIFFAIPMC